LSCRFVCQMLAVISINAKISLSLETEIDSQPLGRLIENRDRCS
jgi:hypothetical protein